MNVRYSKQACNQSEHKKRENARYKLVSNIKGTDLERFIKQRRMLLNILAIDSNGRGKKRGKYIYDRGGAALMKGLILLKLPSKYKSSLKTKTE